MTETTWKRARLLEFYGGLPAGFWGRTLILWGIASVPFFAAFDEGMDLMEERKDAASVGIRSSACSGRGRAFCRTRRR